MQGGPENDDTSDGWQDEQVDLEQRKFDLEWMKEIYCLLGRDVGSVVGCARVYTGAMHCTDAAHRVCRPVGLHIHSRYVSIILTTVAYGSYKPNEICSQNDSKMITIRLL